MRVLSLFDGISCGRLALARAGIDVTEYYASEINEYSIYVSNKNYPAIKHIGDVRNVESSDYSGIDLLIGGSPCQNFSMAGTMQGASTTTGVDVLSLEQYMELKEQGFEFSGYSYLFWEYVRILRGIKPKYFFLENVVMSKKWEKVISEALGVEPVLINSRLVSAQNRPRLYWTNIPNVTQPDDRNLLLKDVLDDQYSKAEELSEFITSRYTPLNKSYAIGTTKPPFRKIGQRDYVYGDQNKMACLVATDYKQPKQVLHNGVIRKISPIEAERLQTLPDNYTAGISNSRRFECIGNGWTVDVIAHIFKGLKEAPTEYEPLPWEV